MTNFQSFGLPETLLQSLNKIGFTAPTPIQAATIPLALSGRDILGSAQTGTGKTAAFSIPLITKVLSSPRNAALVLTPTRELAVQVIDNIKKMLVGTSINTALLIGGESMPRQFDQLRRRPRIIVGTPGRVNDHLARGTLLLHDASFLVLDETDRMLDMGFGVQIEKIIKFMPKTRQTLMFSATLPHNIVKLSDKYLNNPERISIGSSTTPIAKIQQDIIHTTEAEKYNVLLKQLDERKGSIIVFVKTKWGAEKLAKRLYSLKHSAEAIHGDLRQNQRARVIQSFRDKKHRIMVATDIAARGLDIPHIEHVINYNLPQCPEDYIHRIGRTARAGAEGSAVCIISPDESSQWKAINKLMNPGANSNSENNGGERSRSSNFERRNNNNQERKGGNGNRNKNKFRFNRFKSKSKKAA